MNTRKQSKHILKNIIDTLTDIITPANNNTDQPQGSCLATRNFFRENRRKLNYICAISGSIIMAVVAYSVCFERINNTLTDINSVPPHNTTASDKLRDEVLMYGGFSIGSLLIIVAVALYALRDSCCFPDNLPLLPSGNTNTQPRTDILLKNADNLSQAQKDKLILLCQVIAEKVDTQLNIQINANQQIIQNKITENFFFQSHENPEDKIKKLLDKITVQECLTLLIQFQSDISKKDKSLTQNIMTHLNQYDKISFSPKNDNTPLIRVAIQ